MFQVHCQEVRRVRVVPLIAVVPDDAGSDRARVDRLASTNCEPDKCGAHWDRGDHDDGQYRSDPRRLSVNLADALPYSIDRHPTLHC